MNDHHIPQIGIVSYHFLRWVARYRERYMREAYPMSSFRVDRFCGRWIVRRTR